MTRILMYTAAALTFLMVASAALAGPPGKGHGGGSFGGHQGKDFQSNSFSSFGGHHGSGFSSFNSFGGTHGTGFNTFGGTKTGFNTVGTGYHLQFGKTFSHGFYYPGHNHNHWSYFGFSKTYGCNCYWCPYTKVYYYWYEPAAVYYPVSYIGFAPPAKVAGPVGGVVGGPPAGIPAIP